MQRQALARADALSRAFAITAASVVALPLTSSFAEGDSHAKAPAGDELPPMLVVDLHVDVPYQVHFKGRGEALTEGHAHPDTLRRGGYGGLVLPIYIPDYLHSGKPTVDDAEAIYKTIQRVVGKTPIFLPLGAAAHEPGRVGSWLSIEGAGAFASDISAIDRFIARGVRLVGPAHAKNGPLASAATGGRASYGLTDAGKEFCDRVYARGALVDVSHLSDKAFDDLVPIAKKRRAPIVATHSNARQIAKHPRNLTDAQIRTIGETGGVVGLNFYSAFVVTSGDAELIDLVKHLEHVVRLAGIDHVAIGSDFDGGIKPVEGLEDAGSLQRLARYLVRSRGMTGEDVLKLFSLNALRVLGWSATPPAP